VFFQSNFLSAHVCLAKSLLEGLHPQLQQQLLLETLPRLPPWCITCPHSRKLV